MQLPFKHAGYNFR